MKMRLVRLQSFAVSSTTTVLAAAALIGCTDDPVVPSSTTPFGVATPNAVTTQPIPSPPIDVTEPFWYLPFLEAESELELFEGTIAGVRIGNGLDYGPLRCAIQGWEYDATTAAGTPLDVDVRATVGGSTEYQNALVGRCADGSVAIAEADFGVTHGSPVSDFGGNVRIFRHTGAAVASLAIPAIRWSEFDVAGAPAAVAAPILADLGLGQGAIVTYRDGVLTVIHTTGISLDGLLAIGEEVLRR